MIETIKVICLPILCANLV